MSSRSIRKILGDPEEDILKKAVEEESEEEEDLHPSKAFNPFEILNEGNDDDDDDDNRDVDEKIEDHKEEKEVTEVKVELKTKPKQNKKRKKKKKQKQQPQNKKEDEEDLNELLKQMNIEIKETPQKTEEKDVLKINTSYLHPDYEMKKIYGPSVIKEEKKNKKKVPTRFHFEVDRNWPLIMYDNIPIRFESVGIRNDLQCFKCHRSEQYEEAQKLFLEAYNSGSLELLENILMKYPYHLDTLLEFSDALRVLSQEQELVVDLLIRIIHKFEFSFDQNFNPIKRKCRLPYEFKENRCFFLAFVAYITSLGNRGCPRTALEISKFLFTLDEIDPMGILYLIDHFAIRSEEYEFLLDFYYSKEVGKYVENLPNYMFHIALAKFHIEMKKKTTSYDKLSSIELLERAFTYFPSFLHYFSKSLSIGSIKKDNVDLLNHSFFVDSMKEPNHTKHIKLHAEVFLERNSYLWKDQSIVNWIRECITNLIEKIDKSDEKVLERISFFNEHVKSEFDDPPKKELMISTHLTIPKANSLISHDMFPEGLNVYDAII